MARLGGQTLLKLRRRIDSAETRSGGRPDGEVQHVQPVDQHQCAELDHRRIVVEASQSTLHRALKDRGFEPLLLPFLAYGALDGAFHCATLDTRRRGALEDYF